MFRLGYNTNGLAHHRLLDAMRLVAELDYEGIAITPDVGALDPLALNASEVDDALHWSKELGLEIAIETGARFVLDARRKHFPTLLEDEADDRARRVDFLCRSIDLAAALDARIVSLWSGRAPDGVTAEGEDGDRDVAWQRLVEGLKPVLAHSVDRGVQVAFEPEPGMFVERPAGYLELLERLGSDGDTLGLCLDVGHLHCTGDLPERDQITQLAPRLVHVHLDDIADGVHEHRMFGEGDLDLAGVLDALLTVGYDGMAAVELSRDSHRGADAAREAMQHLKGALTSAR